MNSASRTLFAAGTLAWVLSLATPAAAQSQTGMSGLPTWNLVAPGADFYEVGATTRVTGAISTPQTEPIVATMPAPPAGAQVEEVFAAWNYNLNGAAPAFDVVNINGNPVVGNLVGQAAPSLGWGKDRTVTYLAQGVAPHLAFGGSNTIAQATDKALGTDPLALGAGMSIVVVHSLPHGTERRVSLWAGLACSESSTTGEARVLLDLPSAYPGGEAHFMLNGLNGDALSLDGFQVNGIPAGGIVAGTVSANNAWQGLAGPGALNNLYDVLDDDVRDFMTSGDVQLRARTIPIAGFPYQEFAHSLAVLATNEVCGQWVGYCTAQVNSLGCTPVISATGTPSGGAAGASFKVELSNLMNNMNGLFFYGYGEAGTPFQGGTLCVAPPVWRTAVQNSGGSPTGSDCSGQMSFGFNSYVLSGADPLLVKGAVVFGQYWTRDTGDPFGSNLSSALCFDLCP